MSGKTLGMQDASENTKRRSHVPVRHMALSVRQPYASMIAGLCPGREKTIETRVWGTDYRGDLLIVSSLKPNKPKFSWPRGVFPVGKALCIARLVSCRPMTWRDVAAAQCEIYYRAMAWVLTDIRPVEPFPVKGELGLYTVAMPRDLKMVHHEGHEGKVTTDFTDFNTD